MYHHLVIQHGLLLETVNNLSCVPEGTEGKRGLLILEALNLENKLMNCVSSCSLHPELGSNFLNSDIPSTFHEQFFEKSHSDSTLDQVFSAICCLLK